MSGAFESIWREEPDGGFDHVAPYYGRAALRKAYARSELERLLHHPMALYGQETQALSRSLRDPLLRSLVETMYEAAIASVRRPQWRQLER